MEFNILHQINNKEAKWADIMFYLTSLLLITTIFAYCILAIKIYFQHQEVGIIEEKIAAFGSVEQKANEKNVLNYKNKIDDFSALLAAHGISSNVFLFIEENTLPNVWFSNFDLSQSIGEIRLSGEADSMEMLSRQFAIFEASRDVIKSISVVNSQVASTGKIVFTLDIFLNPKIFAEKTPEVEVVPELAPGPPTN